jgi:signal transduction histidine kinase
MALLYRELQGERITVELEVGDKVPRVLASRVQLQQVLLNLITNAIDAMRPIHDRPRLLLVSIATGECEGVVVRVEDSGPGIDPDLRSRVFDPFFTTKSGGMGLGLAICRSIIETHDGKVSVSARHPHGTVFKFVLPACSAEV